MAPFTTREGIPRFFIDGEELIPHTWSFTAETYEFATPVKLELNKTYTVTIDYPDHWIEESTKRTAVLVSQDHDRLVFKFGGEPENRTQKS